MNKEDIIEGLKQLSEHSILSRVKWSQVKYEEYDTFYDGLCGITYGSRFIFSLTKESLFSWKLGLDGGGMKVFSYNDSLNISVLFRKLQENIQKDIEEQTNMLKAYLRAKEMFELFVEE